MTPLDRCRLAIQAAIDRYEAKTGLIVSGLSLTPCDELGRPSYPWGPARRPFKSQTILIKVATSQAERVFYAEKRPWFVGQPPDKSRGY